MQGFVVNDDTREALAGVRHVLAQLFLVRRENADAAPPA